MRIIKNIIFDIGRVLVEYEPLDYLKKLYSAEKAEGLMELVYASREWQIADQGLMDFSALRGVFSQRRPEWADDVRYLISRESMLKIFTPKQETIDLLHELKAAGYKIFLLSNFSEQGFAWIDEIYPFLRGVDGRVISYHAKMNKPDPGIYKLLLSRYKLEPAESVFIDDASANIRAAAELGIHAVQFIDIQSCRRALQEIIQSFK